MYAERLKKSIIKYKNVDKFFSKYIIPGHGVGHGHSHNKRGQRRRHGYENAPSKGGIIILFCEKPDIIFQRKSLGLGGEKASGNQGAERIDEKQQHKCHHGHLYPEPEIQSFSGFYHEITSREAES